MEYVLLRKEGVIEEWTTKFFEGVLALKNFLKYSFDLDSTSIKSAVKSKKFIQDNVEYIIEETPHNVYELSLVKIQALVDRYTSNIRVLGFRSNGPACEEYIHINFVDADSIVDTMVPYVYRRSNLDLFKEVDIASYLVEIENFYKRKSILKWKKHYLSEIKEADTVYTKFLRILIESDCREILQNSFPQNNNPQKNISIN